MRSVAVLATTLLLLAPSAGAQPAEPSAPDTVVPRGHARVTVPVATRAMARGDTLRASDMRLVDTVVVWRWNTLPDTARVQAGWVTRRPIAAGEILRAPAVSPAPAVSSGATVRVIYQDGPVRLLLTGVATNSAPLGAPVGVRIDRTRHLDGVAVAPNTVRLR